jgi:hypothetical protein
VTDFRKGNEKSKNQVQEAEEIYDAMVNEKPLVQIQNKKEEMEYKLIQAHITEKQNFLGITEVIKNQTALRNAFAVEGTIFLRQQNAENLKKDNLTKEEGNLIKEQVINEKITKLIEESKQFEIDTQFKNLLDKENYEVSPNDAVIIENIMNLAEESDA